MQRVKRSTAVATLPSAPAGGSPGYFASPDPAGGVPATVPGYEWYNGVQEELMAVIEGQGLSGSSTDHTKLRQAIAKMIQSSQRSVIITGVTFSSAVTGTGKAVYWDSANSRFDLALADGSAKQNMVGFCDVVNGNVYCFGDAVLFTGLTAGGRYFLDSVTAGAITTTAPANAVFVGISRGATELFVDIDVTGSVPDASTSVKGKVQLANTTTTQTGTDPEKAVTPDGLAKTMLGGVGQAPNDLTGSRSLGTVYTNTTGRPKLVSITVEQATNIGTTTLTVAGVDVCSFAFKSSYAGASSGLLQWVVLPGETYSTNNLGTLVKWAEL